MQSCKLFLLLLRALAMPRSKCGALIYEGKAALSPVTETGLLHTGVGTCSHGASSLIATDQTACSVKVGRTAECMIMAI